MAKKKTPKKKPTKTSNKKPAKTSKKKLAKKGTATSKKISVTDGPLPPKQRDKVLRKFQKLAIAPTHASSKIGPALTLGYDAPLPKKTKRAKKKR
jgi:hypothetical protein